MSRIFAVLIVTFFFLILSVTAAAQPTSDTAQPDKSKKILIVEAACGQCRLGLPGEGCNLAIRLEGKSYFVDGTAIDDHGDAHANDGFCNAVRKAKVQGAVVNNRFLASYFRLVPAAAEPKKEN